MPGFLVCSAREKVLEAEYPYHREMLLPKRLFGLSSCCLEGSQGAGVITNPFIRGERFGATPRFLCAS